MQQIVRPLAVASAVVALVQAALPAAASTLAGAATATAAHATAAAHGAAAATGRGTRAGAAALTPAQERAVARAERLRALLDQRGAISGIVREPDGAPAPDVCVRATGPRATRVGFSRPDGRFVITGLPAGAYRVEYRGCSLASRFIGQWYGGLSQKTAAKVVVTSTEPAELAPVTLHRITARTAPRATRALSTAARVLTLIAGLEASQAGLAGQAARHAAAGLPATTGLRFAAPARSTAAHIYGRVTSRAGHPVGRIVVLAIPAGSGAGPFSGGFAFTMRNGQYSLRVGPGRYRIDFEPIIAGILGTSASYAPQLWKGAGSVARATVLRVRARAVLRHIDAVLGVGAAIAGRVRSGPNAHASFAGICVLAQGTHGQRLFVGAAITHADGTFRLTGLATGKYRLMFVPGCGPSPAYLPATLPRPVSVRDGKTTTGVSAYLRLGGSITGVVEDSDGHPVPGICVEADSDTGLSASAITGSRGRYRVQGLVTADYWVRTDTGCGNNGPYAPTIRPAPVHARAGRTTAGIDVTMPFEGRLAGVVKTASGKPLAGVCVVASGPDPLDPSAFGATTASGTYRLNGLPAGRNEVAFFPGGCGLNGNYLEVDTLTTVTAKATTVLNAVLPAGGLITGVASDTHGRPLAGICIFVVDRGFGEQAVTGRDGRYVLNQLSSGSYYVVFAGGCGNGPSVAPQAYHADPTFFAPSPVRVTAGKTTSGVGAILMPGGTITGRITDRGSGQPLTGVCVLVTAVTGAGSGGFGDVEVSRHGSFRSANLPPGQYSVLFSGRLTGSGDCGPSRYASQLFRALGSGAVPDLLSVRGGVVTTGADAALAPAGEITGVVSDRAGPPYEICVMASDPRTHVVGETITGPLGGYAIPGLPAGRYQVEFSDCLDGVFASQWYPHQPTSASAVRVVVRAKQVTPKIDARLRTGGVIAGQVRYAAGNRPIAGVCVFAINLALNSASLGFTDRAGRYAVTGLSTSGYLMLFAPCEGEAALAAEAKPGMVHATAGRTTGGVDELLGDGGSVSGVVRASMAGVSRGAPGTCVLALPLGFGLGNNGWAGSAGGYSVTNLAPGSYLVIFGFPQCSANSPSLAAQLYAAGPVKVTARQDTSGIDATLGAAGGIGGVVRARGGVPLSGICAEAVPVLGGASTVVGVTASGRYRIVGLQSGPYQVRFTTGCGAAGYATRWYPNAPDRQQAATVHVSPGTLTTGVDVTLPRG